MLDPVLVGLIERLTRLEMAFQTLDQQLAKVVTPLEQDLQQRRAQETEQARQAELDALRARISELERPPHDLGATEGRR